MIRQGGLVERTAPVLFLLLWSGGYIAGRLGLAYATPIAMVAIRFVLAAAIFAVIAFVLRARWPRGIELFWVALVGLLNLGVHFVLVYLAFASGVGAGTAALINALQPVITACIAMPLLDERVRPWQWLGLVLGLVGVTLVIWNKLALGLGTPGGIVLVFAAMLALTGGVLLQKRFCPSFDLWAGGTVQYLAAAAFSVAAAFLAETPSVTLAPGFLGVMAYLVLANSIVAVTLLNLMIHRGEAARVTSLLYLVPGLAALLAWLILGETFSLLAMLGLVAAGAGVWLVLAGGSRRA
ncbi:MAG TPA: DMT family transporter [Geminicoccus sp.]|uniref:DMT family transporter n=1 Tax=Geminicoccus sp. TaxID=2024832 RepID=UPI002D0CD337|nr:DMT family transporter [Geminicoccus sp.]HWL69356.1 DMT family transporter [Geminicoccus sp.]